MKKKERCYNCGKELKEGQSTKEHIPAKTMFIGYDSNFKTIGLGVFMITLGCILIARML